MNLGKSVLTQYKRILKEVGSDCIITYKGQEKCPGAFNSLGEFDNYKDVLYHNENPDAPVCENGYIGGKQIKVKCNIYDRYSSFNDKYGVLGLISDNESVLFFLPEVDLENVEYFTINNTKFNLRDTKTRFDDNTEELKYAVVEKVGG